MFRKIYFAEDRVERQECRVERLELGRWCILVVNLFVRMRVGNVEFIRGGMDDFAFYVQVVSVYFSQSAVVHLDQDVRGRLCSLCKSSNVLAGWPLRVSFQIQLVERAAAFGPVNPESGWKNNG